MDLDFPKLEMIFSLTRDDIFLNSSKRCLTNYIEILNMFSPLIPPLARFELARFELKSVCHLPQRTPQAL